MSKQTVAPEAKAKAGTGFNDGKDKFKLLDADWKDEVSGLSVEDLKLRIAKVAKDQEELETAQENDEDLQSLKDQVSDASAPYKDGKKANRLRIKFLLQAISDKGGE
jgi:hypothetical protein